MHHFRMERHPVIARFSSATAAKGAFSEVPMISNLPAASSPVAMAHPDGVALANFPDGGALEEGEAKNPPRPRRARNSR